MPGFDGTGPRGMGSMTGGGRGFCNPRGVGTNRRYPAYSRSRAADFQPPAPRMDREQELEFLKNQAQSLKDELKKLETEIENIAKRK